MERSTSRRKKRKKSVGEGKKSKRERCIKKGKI